MTIQKLDPYLNVDPGTMSPYQHGEVFVTDDGAETDLDLGHYERFIDENLTVNSYRHLRQGLLERAEPGASAATIWAVPFRSSPTSPTRSKSCIYRMGKTSNADVVITEIGGTVGDIESQPFLEAIRQVGREAAAGRTSCTSTSLWWSASPAPAS